LIWSKKDVESSSWPNAAGGKDFQMSEFETERPGSWWNVDFVASECGGGVGSRRREEEDEGWVKASVGSASGKKGKREERERERE
jgi:hypothetical protein